MSEESTGAAFLDRLEEAGYDWFGGVPCSILKHVIRRLEDEPRYGWLCAPREDSAVGAAVGAWLGGRRPAVFMQNSGFTVCYNALSALSLLYRVPALLVVSWRGHGPDAPEHIHTGATTETVFGTLGIPYLVLEPDRMADQIREATAVVTDRRIPAGILVRKGVLT